MSAAGQRRWATQSPALCDTGHEAGTTDASWALKLDRTPDEAKRTDYYFRATHQVTVATKELAEQFFAQGEFRRAYFDGCFNGGRMALMEASRFPDDFDGIIAGDPFMSIRSIAGGARFFNKQLTLQNFIPCTLLPLIDQATLAACDAADGVNPEPGRVLLQAQDAAVPARPDPPPASRRVRSIRSTLTPAPLSTMTAE
jgi:hypothetical protein